MNMRYNCRRCGYNTNIKCNLINHFERKKLCKPLIENIDIETLKQELDKKKNPFCVNSEEKILKNTQNSSNNTNPQYYLENQLPYSNNINKSEENFIKLRCEFCKKKYSRIDNLKRHLNSCKRKKEADITLIKEKNEVNIDVIKEYKKEAEIAKKEAEIAKKEAEIAKKEAEIAKKK